jgi:hypothetical protein
MLLKLENRQVKAQEALASAAEQLNAALQQTEHAELGSGSSAGEIRRSQDQLWLMPGTACCYGHTIRARLRDGTARKETAAAG